MATAVSKGPQAIQVLLSGVTLTHGRTVEKYLEAIFEFLLSASQLSDDQIMYDTLLDNGKTTGVTSHLLIHSNNTQSI